MLIQCKCKDCFLFTDKEDIGWKDTGNGWQLVYCNDGKIRYAIMKNGCSDFVDKKTIN